MPFVPLQGATKPARGFIPLDTGSAPDAGEETRADGENQDLHPEVPAKPGALRQVLLNNPATAAVEAAANFGSQMVAVPVSGIAGLAAEAARAVGLTDRKGADVVHAVGNALTYQPRGELGQAAAGVLTWPFEKLAEGGQFLGGKTLDASGSPLAATAVDTAVNMLPLAIGPALKRVRKAQPEAGAPQAEAEPSAASRDAARGTASEPEPAPERPKAPPKPDEFEDVPFLRNGASAEAKGFTPVDPPADAPTGTRRPEAREAQGQPQPAPEPQTPATDRPLAPPDVIKSASSPEAQGLAPTASADSAPRGARYALVEARDLKASHDVDMRALADYPEAMVRSDWSRADAEQRVQTITREFDPQRLGAAAEDAHGAPVIAADGVVEAGNARAIALQRIYQANGAKADAYRQFLQDRASEFGLLPEEVASMERPVLVRVRTSPIAESQPQLDPTRIRAEVEATEAAPRLPDPATETQAASASGDAMPGDGTVNAWAPGANYVGFIDDSPKPGAATAPGSKTSPQRVEHRAEPIRREDVLIPFAKALNTGIYESRIQRKGVLGFFRPKSGELRIRRHADLETAAHEMAHLLDHRIPELRKAWLSGPDMKVHQAELRGLSYDSGKLYEGFAEFVRHWMTQPDVAQTKAPNFTRWFDGFVKSHSYGPAIQDARAGMRAWFEQDALDRARSKIGDHKPMADALDRRWDAFRQATIDDLHGVYRLERDMKGGKLDPNGPYESARLTRASSSIADGAIRYGAPELKADGSYGFKGRGLEEILRPLEDLDAALLYFVGRSARELASQGREHLFTSGELDAMLKLRSPEYDKAFSEYQQWNAGVLDFAEAHGVINPAARAQWQRTEYLPFHRVGTTEGGFTGKPGDWTGIKALTGGTENIRDVLGNITGNAAMLIDKAVKNGARLKVAELAEQPGGGKFMAKIPPESRPVKLPKEQVIASVLKSMGLDGDHLTPAQDAAAKRVRRTLNAAPAMLDMLQPNMPPAGRNVVAVLREGKPVWYEVADPILLRALESIDRPPPPWVVKWLGLPKRIGQTTITLTPDFMIANIARDTIMGGVMSRAGFRPILDSLSGMRLRLQHDPMYKDFIANGGGLSSMFLDEAKFRAKLSHFYERQGIDYKTVLNSPEKLLGFVETMADAFEMSTRLGEYKRAVGAGDSPRHAAYLAREVSTDFAMRGDSKALGFLYDTVMFLRPAVVSWDRLYRGLAHDPNRGAIATKAGMLALMSAGLYLLNRDDARYLDLPDWDRDSHWHFFIGDQHFRYPKVWEIGAMASAAERTVERMLEGDGTGMAKDFARILGNTFGLNLMPQIVAPLYEQAANRNSFTKAPIETPGMENVQPFMRAKPTTSETLKAAGMASRDLPEALQINPVRTEALLRGYFNTWAVYGLAIADAAMADAKGPTARLDQMPVLRRFYSQEPPLHTKYETEFYDMLGQARRLHGSLVELDRTGRSDIADQKEREPLAPESKQLERASKGLQAINREMRAVRRSDLSPEDMRDRLDALTVERNDLLKRSVKDAKAAQKERAAGFAEQKEER